MPDAETAPLLLYLDESGGSDPGTPSATLGGMLIYRNALLPFNSTWDQMLANHGIPDGIHMRELGQHGKLGTLSNHRRRRLFEDACNIIKIHKAMILVASLDNQEYETNVPAPIRKISSAYGLLFDLAVMMNHKLAEANDYKDAIPIIMDDGNPKKQDVKSAHEFMLDRVQQGGTTLHLGSLYFKDDKSEKALQAADIIAWGVRRRVSRLRFMPGLEPVEELLDSNGSHHSEIPWKLEWLKELGADWVQQIANGEEVEMPPDEEIGKRLAAETRRR